MTQDFPHKFFGKLFSRLFLISPFQFSVQGCVSVLFAPAQGSTDLINIDCQIQNLLQFCTSTLQQCSSPDISGFIHGPALYASED